MIPAELSSLASRPRFRPAFAPGGAYSLAAAVARYRRHGRLSSEYVYISLVTASTEPRERLLLLLFPASSLAGTAGCQLLLRPGGAALFCFRCCVLLSGPSLVAEN